MSKQMKSFMQACKTKHITQYTMIELKNGCKYISNNKYICGSAYFLQGESKQSISKSPIKIIYRVFVLGNEELLTHHTFRIVLCKSSKEYFGYPIFSNTGILAHEYILKNQNQFTEHQFATFITNAILPKSRWVKFRRINDKLKNKDKLTGIMELCQPEGYDEWIPVGYVQDVVMEMIKVQLHINKNDCCVNEGIDGDVRFTEWNLAPSSFQFVINQMPFI